MPLCKWHTFWMAPCLICYFIVILFYIERKWLLMRNLATILPLKSKLSGKFQPFNAIVGSIAMIRNGWISNIVRHFTMPKQRAALKKKLFSLPQLPPIPPPSKVFRTEKYTDICFQSASRMRFLGVKKWSSANVISGTKQNHVCCIAIAYCFRCQVSWDS